MPNTDEIVEAIMQYQPERDNWLSLDKLLANLWATGEPERGIDALFSVFERFPEHDGYGVFWAVLHGLESLSDYEFSLVKSLWRQPTHFNVLMLDRVLNAGQNEVGDTDGLTLLREVLRHPGATQQARQDAQDSINRHTTST